MIFTLLITSPIPQGQRIPGSSIWKMIFLFFGLTLDNTATMFEVTHFKCEFLTIVAGNGHNVSELAP